MNELLQASQRLVEARYSGDYAAFKEAWKDFEASTLRASVGNAVFRTQAKVQNPHLIGAQRAFERTGS